MQRHRSTITAPFTDEQVRRLNDWQHNGRVHPFTCGRCRDRLGVNFIRNDAGELEHDTMEETLEERMALVSAGRIVILDRELIATNKGWVCRTCDYTQDWAWEPMTREVPAWP